MFFYLVTGIYIFLMICTAAVTFGRKNEQTGLIENNKKAYMTFKILTSACMLVLAIAAFLACKDKIILTLIPFFFFSFIGDLFFTLSNDVNNKVKNPQFTLGIISFSIAQVLIMIILMKLLDWHVGWITIMPFIVLGLNFIMWKKKDFDFGSNKIPFCVYMATGMMSAGLGVQLILSEPGSITYLMLGIGAVLLLFSNAILGIKVFWTRDTRWAGPVFILIYFIGMWCILYSIKFTLV